MLYFSKLRLTGFKSFVDPTELQIKPGLTGVVGPNGCGKSNLVEALRWVMGESSAKQMRGSGMEDVIFGGTADRPARNIAEVVLDLDNLERSAPPQFNEFEELYISRRIEREKGSTYRVNGVETRAKDVQLLFADSSTGARSTAMVSQGRIGAVIRAKPSQRRSLLEEAAGITGLHSRRHEAELRLRGAETNLDRLEDILNTLEEQLQGLKKQSRQANRYRNLSDHIRRAEATLYYLRWRDATEKLDQYRSDLKISSNGVNELTIQTASASKTQVEAATKLPKLRQMEAQAAAKLHSLNVARNNLNEEKNRVDAAQLETERRILQIEADLEREHLLAKDATKAIKNLDEEHQRTKTVCLQEEKSSEIAKENLVQANQAVNALDTELNELNNKFAKDEAKRSSLNQAVDDLMSRVERLKSRLNEAEAQKANIEDKAIAQSVLSDAKKELQKHDVARNKLRKLADAADQLRIKTTEAISQVVSQQHSFQNKLTRLLAEEQALSDVLKSDDSNEWPAIIDEVTVKPGYEAALGAVLGEDLSASSLESAPVTWRNMLPFTKTAELPEGAEPLSRVVSGPAALNRRLSQIGIISAEADGTRLAERLTQGQSLVSQEGAMWRWDGYTVTAGAETAAAARLQQRNRLNIIRDSLADARADVARADANVTKAQNEAAEAQAAEREARANAEVANCNYDKARDTLTVLKEKAAHHSSKILALVETAKTHKADIVEAEARAFENKQTLKKLPDTNLIQSKITTLRADLAEHRAVQVEFQSTFDSLVRAAEDRRHRLISIENDLANWQARFKSAKDQIKNLTERNAIETNEINRLFALPKDIEQRRDVLAQNIHQLELMRTESADKLAKAENHLAGAEKALRNAEATLAKAREDRVRAQGLVEQVEQAVKSINERVLEKLDVNPEQLFNIAGLDKEKALPELNATERRVERLVNERENMGPVNLRAEQETKELTEKVQSLEIERDDLIEAIAKLRKGISELNREGRQRLLKSFQEVDMHFRKLFERLFGGGHAHLNLVDSEDPLEAGLEIMASPPGKRLQSLSLLSGGEQALTALALLFGVFLTNPAPICVLDEVDAPLDDSNVDRFCALLKEMASTGTTRFMVVTHHRLTMAKMDRLFGVTMPERGVSKLVSVDLEFAEKHQSFA